MTAAASFVVAASTAFLPAQSFLSHTLDQYLDLFFLLGASGLGVSLFLIHIYVTEIKRTLQALWALGIVGSLLTYTALAQPAGQGLVHYVVDNPTAVWFVGPLFASLTGLVFKEGIPPSNYFHSILLTRRIFFTDDCYFYQQASAMASWKLEYLLLLYPHFSSAIWYCSIHAASPLLWYLTTSTIMLFTAKEWS